MNRAADIVFDEAGQGDPPVICLHGIGGDTESFRPQLDGLSGDRRIIAWNMPGYGGSPLLEATTFKNLASALKSFMNALGIERAHLLGQSVGGMIAIEFALTYPERVASLALIGTTSAFGGRDDSFKDEFIKKRLAPLDAGLTMADVAASLVPEIVGPAAGTEARDSATRSMSAVPEATYRAVMDCLVTFDRRDDINRVRLPCCLIVGSHDRNAPPRTMARMAEKFPQASFHVVEGAGHLTNLEAPAETNAILKTFLEETA